MIKTWVKTLRTQNIPLAMVMTNNHLEGFDPASANSLRLELGMSELIWEGKKQTKLAYRQFLKK